MYSTRTATVTMTYTDTLENLAKACSSCQRNKHAPAPAPLHPWTWPTKPWQRIHMDFAGPFMGTSFLVIVDAHSKWPEVFEMSSTSTSKTITVLRQLFAKYGLPEQVVSDNGPQFTSEEFRHFVKDNGIKHIRCAPYHPASNGAVERFNQTFKQALRAREKDGRPLTHRLEDFLLTYRSTPHATTNRTPSSLFLQRELRTRLTLLQPDVRKHVLEKQAEQARHHNQHVKLRNLQVGQRVMVRNLRPTGPKWVPGTITQQTGPLSFIVDVNQGVTWKRHIDHLRERTAPDSTSFSSFEAAKDDGGIPISVTDDTTDPDTTDDTAAAEQESAAPRTYPSRVRKAPDRYM